MPDQEVDAHVRDTLEEGLRLLWVLEQPRLRFLKRLAPSSFNHVREQRPWRAAEADEGDLAVESVPRLRDRLEDVSQLLLDIDLTMQLRDILGCIEWVWKAGTRVHQHLHAHRLRDDQDVAEYNGGVDEA